MRTHKNFTSISFENSVITLSSHTEFNMKLSYPLLQNCEALLRTCEGGDLRTVTSLLAAKINVNTRNQVSVRMGNIIAGIGLTLRVTAASEIS